MEKPQEETESAVFNMALDTLKRLGIILSEIKGLAYKTDLTLEILQQIKIHLVKQFFIQASPLLPEKSQFNYLWLSPTTLRECYFREGRNQSRFKSMTELSYPSLVIYPIGNVMSVSHGAWGDILLDLITHRESLGKPTWILESKSLNKCPEVQSSSKLESFLINEMPKLSLGDADVYEDASEILDMVDKKTGSYI